LPWNLERPNLKWLCFDGLVVALRYGDDVEQPKGAALLGDVLDAIGVGDAANKRVPEPAFGAGELIEVVFAEGMLGHGVLLK
jgi:hypothetical protein